MAKFYDVNRDITANANGEVLYRIMTTLVAAGWVVKSSGDGLAAFDPAGSTAITGPASGANGMNNTKAWFRIQDPGARREFVFQRGATTTNGRAKYSALDKFVTAPTGGGTLGATVTPSATDEQAITGGGTDTVPTYVAIWGTPSTSKANVIAQSTPEGNVYGFWCFLINTATGVTAGGTLFCDAMAATSFPSSDADPCIVATPTGTSSAYIVTSTFVSAWFRMNLTGEAFGPIDLAQVTFASQTAFGTTPYVGANPYDGDANGIPVPAGRTSIVARPGFKGFTKFLRYKGQANVFPDTINLATDAYVFVDYMLIPWPEGVTPTL